MNAMPHGGHGAQGFTLTEMAVVLAIVGFLLGSLMFTLSAQTESRTIAETDRRLALAKELILNFAVVNARLPCPALAPSQAPFSNAGGTGAESPSTGGACTDFYTGFVPGRAVGFQPVYTAGYALDAWGNPLRYAVSRITVNGVSNRFTTGHTASAWNIAEKPNDLVVCATWAASTTTCGGGTSNSVTNTQIIVAVIWSQGKNFASRASAGIGSGGASNDELANNKHRLPSVQNDHPVFVWHAPTPSTASTGEYDDQMVWIPVGELYARMISAGILP